MLRIVFALSLLTSLISCGDAKKEELQVDACKQIFGRIVEISRECAEEDRRRFGAAPYTYRGFGYCLYDNCCFSSRGGREFLDLSRQYRCAE